MWTALDPVSAVLLELRVQGTFFCRSELATPWVMDVPARDFASFHFVVSGECWIALPEQRTRKLEPGQMALVSRSPAHKLSSQKSLRGQRVDFRHEQRLSEVASTLRHGAAAGPQTLVICGGLRFGGFVASFLGTLLPSLIVTGPGDAGSTLRLALDEMISEARTPRPGGATVMGRLLDIVTIEAFRTLIESRPAAESGWLRALRDPDLGRALIALHEQPEHDWSLESLAAVAHMSRSVFARRFAESLEMPPKQYLTRVRMYRALDALEREPISVAELAHRLGYDSEAAFARAFKRHIGISPSAARRRR